MRNIFAILISVVMVFCSSCYHRENANDGITYHIEYSKDAVFDWNKLIDIKEIVPLEVNDSCLLSYAMDCIVTSNKVIYHDYKQKAVFVFSRSGEFLYKIDKLGQGDKEYFSILDMTLSYDEKSILILDDISVLTYDIENGNFQNRFSWEKGIAFGLSKIVNPGKDSFYFWAADKNYSLLACHNGKLKPLRKKTGAPLASQQFYRDSNGNLMFISDYGDFHISRIKNDTVTPVYTFDFGKFNLPHDMIPQTVQQEDDVDAEPYFKCILSAYETSNSLFISALSPIRNYYHIYIDKANGNIISGNPDPKNPLTIVYAEKDGFWGVFYPSLLKGEGLFSDIMNQYSLNEDSNPVLIKFDFKP